MSDDLFTDLIKVEFEEHKVKAVEVTPRCQKHQHQMIWDGLALTSNPLMYRHACVKGCSVLFNKPYPCIEFRK
jgi:hypothetical protein